MPNWCLNKLTIEHSDKDMVDRFVKAYNKGTVCNEFIPEPNDIGDGWWDWRVNNWGVKWDVGADEGTDREEWHGLKASVVGNQASCSFDSPWAPPIPLYEKMVELGYDVKASYFEPGMAFCGIYDNGADNYIEYTNKDMIPVAIWNEFDCGAFFSEDEEVKV
jgi:hypothetical protein